MREKKLVPTLVRPGTPRDAKVPRDGVEGLRVASRLLAHIQRKEAEPEARDLADQVLEPTISDT